MANVPHCELYDQGYKRLGCVGCPMSSRKETELERYPKIKAAYMRAFARMIKERERRGKNEHSKHFTSPDGVMNWWLEKEQPGAAKIDGQIGFEELADGNE